MTIMWTSLDTSIAITAALSAAACALVGNFLLLRRMSMMGDAISHAVLPGLAIAFLITHSRSSLPMFVGAAIIGLLTAVAANWLNRTGKVDEGASLGITFTALFAMGLILLVKAADHVDLDPGCVLYGAVEMAPLDTVRIGSFDWPRAAVVNGAVLLINALVVGLMYKEFKISSFDPALATSLGIPAATIHYILMTLVAVTAVAAFETVGSILVIAMLIVPPATAFLLTRRLSVMIVMSLVVAVASAALGHLAAISVPGWFGYRDTTTSGAIAAMAGLLFTLAVVFAPREGLVSRLVARIHVRISICAEDILGLLYRIQERNHEPAAMLRLLGEARQGWTGWWASRRLISQGDVRRLDGQLQLTDSGSSRAANLMRSHRLWESYLVQDAGFLPEHVHGPAELLEHVTGPRLQRLLAETRKNPTADPHGHAIPPKTDAR